MKKIFLSFAALGLLSLAGCSKAPANPEWIWGDNTQEEKPNPELQEPNKDIVDKGWKNVTAEFGELPAHISVYSSPEQLLGAKAKAFIAVADMKSAKFDIWSITDPNGKGSDEKFRTPSDVYNTEKFPIVMNAGFFYGAEGKSYSSSLAVKDGKILTRNINYASEDWVKIYYPTRAAFIGRKDGTFEACWTYSTTDGNDYVYSQPAPNSWDKEPENTPNATFPCKAETLKAKTAIGGGPLLVRDGKKKDTFVEELFNGATGIAPDSRQPRSAIGSTKDGKLIFFVCEGRQMTEGVKGFTTGQVADILIELGCVQAINLDGGGSSCLLVNGKQTITPSDKGKQRPVGSVVMMK